MIYAKKKYILNTTKYGHLNRSNSNIEVQIVEVSKVNFKTVVLINIYRPPSGLQQDFLLEIASILESLGDLRYPDLYIVGDLNMDHMPGKLNENTQTLISLMQTHGLSQMISVPTRRTVATSTILDIMYIRSKKELHPYILKTSMSDHYLVGCV